MAKVLGPLAPRKSLGEALRRARDAAGLGLEQVAADLLISSSKLSRLENGQGTPRLRDVRDLVKYYKLADEAVSRMTAWVHEANKKGWWVDYSESLPEGLDAHIAYESDATVERVYTIPVLPVLLHTVDYIRAIYRAYTPGISNDVLEPLVQARLKRQLRVTGFAEASPLHLHAITHECSLRQTVGSPKIMEEQLSALLEYTTRDNIELQIFPSSAQPTFSTGCMYAILEFDDTFSGNVVTVENHAGFAYFTDSENALRYRSYFDELARRSLDSQESRQLIETVRQQFSEKQR